MDSVGDELEVIVQILATSHRLSQEHVDLIRGAKPNPVFLAVVEQFRVDHDLVEAADTLRLACESGFLEKVDEVCQYGQLVDEEAQILFQLQQYIPLRLEPARPSELEQYLLTPGGVNAEQALTSAVFGFVSPHNSVVVESESTIGLPFDDEINAEIVELLFKGQSTFPISTFVPDRPTETQFPNFPFGRPPKIAANADEYFPDDHKKETETETNTVTSQEEKSVPRKAPTKITVKIKKSVPATIKVPAKKKATTRKMPASESEEEEEALVVPAPRKLPKKVTGKVTKSVAEPRKKMVASRKEEVRKVPKKLAKTPAMPSLNAGKKKAMTKKWSSMSSSEEEEDIAVPEVRKLPKKVPLAKTPAMSSYKASTTKTAKKKATTKKCSSSSMSSSISSSSMSSSSEEEVRKVPKKVLKAPLAKSTSSLRQPVKLASVFGNFDEEPCKARKATKPEKLDKVFLAPTLVLVGQDVEPRKKIASFDMDSTLIKTLSGAKFPTSRTDWQWLDPCVPSQLKQLYNSGYKIVIFTNQAGVSSGNQNLDDIVGKIQDISKSCGVPIQAFIATHKDSFRKPNTAMWSELVSIQKPVEISISESFFVGDAAGRPANGDKKKDFSCDDRKFAHNLCLKFFTESEFFLSAPGESFSWMGVDPKTIQVSQSTLQAFDSKFRNFPVTTQEMVLNIGPPASGKSTFTRKYLVPAGYVWVNQDTLKTPAKCMSAAREALESGKSVVIDNTNPGRDKRATWIALAQEFKVPVRVLLFDTDWELAQHLNRFREKMTNGAVQAVPGIAYNMFKAHYVAPNLNEGIKEIVHVPFVLNLDSTSRIMFDQF